MARPPKNKAIEPAKIAVAPPPQQRHIDVDNFIRVRDSVYARLATIQDLIKSFATDYLRQTNLLLGEGTNIEDGQQLLAGFEHAFNGLIQPQAPPPAPVGLEKKERKKRTHDPNAPKRPLTPYFLYMQTARPIIASDLGETAPKGAVQEEGQRRWAVMGESEKAGWNQAYQYNLRLYQARVESYKSGNKDAKSMTDDEALAYANAHPDKIPDKIAIEDVIANEQDAIAEQLAQSSVPEPEAEEEEEPAAPVAKTPKKANNTRKRKTATPAAEPEAKAAATPASPANKRKRTSTKVEPAEEPKKSARKKAKN
ncbi:hypothetical protein GE09DRAFT_1127931 [Coniochaeta sp. 2T2.1]|nr:hypothetical protein GE09DRAFT_1127931 [Coniochaeta sp. 2T2.1]